MKAFLTSFMQIIKLNSIFLKNNDDESRGGDSAVFGFSIHF